MAHEAAHDGSFDVSSERCTARQEAELLREKGNAAFQRKAFELAVSLYSEAIEKSSDNHHVTGADDQANRIWRDVQLLFSNRSAALLALRQSDRALADAERAVQLAPTWPKAHVRTAAALEALAQWQRAADAYSRAATLTDDPQQRAKHKRKAAQLQTRAKTTSTSTANPAVPRGFLSTATASLYSEKDDVTGDSPDDNDARSWRAMLRRLTQSSRTTSNNVLANGVFAQLLRPRDFQALVYPGLSPEQLAHAPTSLQALLTDPWYETELLALMPTVEAKAASVLANVKARGAANGDAMDAATEQALTPQVLHEAFGRELLAMVRRVNARKHVQLTNDIRSLADGNDPRAMRDQLPDTFLDMLVATTGTAAAVLDGFMGDEWAALLRADVQRMAATGLLLATPSSAATETSMPPPSGRMRFVEPNECARTFPAIAELLEQLHALPFEINRKRPAHASLCAPFPHCTAVQQLRAGESQPLRLDCGFGVHDNGCKVTCVYFVTGDSVEVEVADDDSSTCDSDPSAATLQLRAGVNAPALQRVHARADRLVAFASQRVLNELTAPRAGDELLYVTFWIHGQTLQQQEATPPSLSN